LHAGQFLIQTILPKAHPGGCDHQSAFGRVANSPIGLVAVRIGLEHGVITQGRAQQQQRDLVVDVQQRLVLRAQECIRTLQLCCEVKRRASYVEGRHRHTVLGQSAGLVGADRRHRAQSLDRR